MSQLLHGDCLDLLPTLPSASIELVLVDPPYYRVKNEKWDRQWANRADFLAWMDALCQQWRRILKPNGSLYVFASPQMAAHVEVTIDRHFHVLNRIRWQKRLHSAWKQSRDSQRMFISPCEEIIFAEHYGADSMALGESGYAAQCEHLRGFVFEPLRAYLSGELKRAGIKPEWCNEACQTRSMAARHYFTRSQWALPTKPHYHALQRMFNERGDPTHGPFLRREYEDLRREYEDLRREYEDLRREYEDLRREYEDLRREYEDLRRPFMVTEAVPYTDVWTFNAVPPHPGRHPCEKPLPLLEHIITASSRPGAVILDCFAGSMTTAIAALHTGREYICMERDDTYFAKGTARVERERALAHQTPLMPQEPAA